MCDNDSFDDMIQYELKKKELSRRGFGALTLGAGLFAMLPPVANAAEVKESEVEIKTPDGTCDAHFVHPASGTAPGVVVWPDIFGLRPAFRQMGKRLAESGYSVLTINPFYRTKKAPTSTTTAFDDSTRATLMGLAGSLNEKTAFTDAKAFVDWLDKQAPVDKKRKMGTTGYCMGGPLVMRTAATMPARVGAGATFHGGGLVTDKPDSPHLLVPKIKAHFLFAIADNDDMKEPESKNVLRESFAKAKLATPEIEVYKGAQHGWCPPDSRAYDQASAEKAWGRLLELFKTSLA
ncbi:MAG TPA: dienelactone hydrolase family protein [Steroidobacteraceae bacterium]|jgi:carboxymethylenebutenolidase|nr:dienelactone hydrolase family protein [Steroidobacteraceae bacterium]